ncbi:hypothetical protein FHL15_005340 [Xylaria flabelliformis]|uniref:Uncharacterized protein n=1 Tax=Xylaria flabelliformis TaxID=2512241 RepID=A0A553I0D5_9PEZI|nr:hypothetical protein FHL15_005340 [Xylaria flabelliformis]
MANNSKLTTGNLSNTEKPPETEAWSDGKTIEKKWTIDLNNAVRNNSAEEVKQLLKNRDAKIAARGQKRDPDNQFGAQGLVDALCLAIEMENSSLAIQLIRANGAKLSSTRSTDASCSTPLHMAVKWENLMIVKELIQHPECVWYINNADKYGRAALHEAAARGSCDIVEILLAIGADVDVRDADDMTPLHLMVWYRTSKKDIHKNGNQNSSTRILRGLLIFGADVNTKDSNGSTPLHDSCFNSDLDITTALLEYGADTDAKNADGKTPRDVVDKDNKELYHKVDGLSHKVDQLGIEERKKVANVPTKKPICPDVNRQVCDNASVYVRHYSGNSGNSWAVSTSVRKLIYDGCYQGKTGLQHFYEQFRDVMLNPPIEGEKQDIWRWIHLSANNVSIMWSHSEHQYCSDVTNLTDRYYIDDLGKGYDSDEKSQVWSFWERTIDTKKAGAENKRIPHAQDSWKEDRLRNSTDDSEGDSSAGSKRASNEKDRKTFPRKRKLSLVLPFIDIETRSYLDRGKGGEAHGKMKKMMDLFTRYSPYKGKEGLQAPRTLDASYYDMLELKRIRERDEDQVVLKWFKSQKTADDLNNDEFYKLLSQYRIALDDEGGTTCGSEKSRNGKDDVEIVDSHEDTPTTAIKGKSTPHKYDAEGHATGDTAKLLMVHQLWLWKLDDNRCHTGAGNTLIDTIRQGGIESMKSPDDLIERILYECATFLDELQRAGLKAHVLDIFDNEIANKSDLEVIRFKQFKQYMEERNRRKSPDIAAEIKLLYEVKDIRDELHLLKRIFEAQSRVLSEFTRLFWPGDQTRRDSFLDDCAVQGLIDRTNLLDDDARRTLDSLNYLVTTKQAQTSLDEAETARYLNKYILLFTIVTIIFTPLSFMTSLFAVPVKQFPHDQNSTLSYDSTWFAGMMLAGELTTLTVIAPLRNLDNYSKPFNRHLMRKRRQWTFDDWV